MSVGQVVPHWQCAKQGGSQHKTGGTTRVKIVSEFLTRGDSKMLQRRCLQPSPGGNGEFVQIATAQKVTEDWTE